MNIDIKNRSNIIIFLFIVSIMVISFVLRILPSFSFSDATALNFVAEDDPMYNLRQIESLIQNFPRYQWFDPMTLYPTGQVLNWGPVFTFICTIACILFGASTRPEIVYISLMIPPLLAVGTIPVVYLIANKVFGRNTAIFSALFTAFVFGQYFTRSMYGYLDHHIAEVFFSTLFCLVYISAVYYMRDTSLKTDSGYNKKWILYAIGSGLFFVLGLYVMPTMIFFSLIVFFYTLIQFIVDAYEKKSSLYLLVLNVTTFGIAIISLFTLGFASDVLTLVNYSLAHAIVYMVLIGETVLFYSIREFNPLNVIVKKYPIYFFGSIIAAIIIILLNLPESWGAFLDGGVRGFFGRTVFSLTVQEARGWSVPDALGAFNVGIILMILGMIIVGYYFITSRKSGYIFTSMWFLLVLFSTIQHIRYEYYMAIVVALFSGVFVGFIIDIFGTRSKNFLDDVLSGKKTDIIDEPVDKKKKKMKAVVKPTKKVGGWDYISVFMVIFVLVSSGMFVYMSVTNEYVMSSSGSIRLNQDWRVTLEWFGKNTPDTGVDYLKVYDQNTFEYPDTAYGVMSWWDYGHMITFLSKRIPNSNPFQTGVYGPNGSAAYFMAESEGDANIIAKNIGTKYVITDTEMAAGKFWAMATWYNSTLVGTPYQPIMLAPDPNNPMSGNKQTIQLLTDKYYQTMVARLHLFDGSYVPASDSIFIEYKDTDTSGTPYPLIQRGIQVDPNNASVIVSNYEKNPVKGVKAVLAGLDYLKSPREISALKTYRLIYESPTTTISDGASAVKYVKVFERVDGYEIKGDGMIEATVMTNTGRIFEYMQKSENGVFRVPYSTIGCPYNTRVEGQYHIVGTDTYIDVNESDIK